jgi:hypothetical protein
MVSPTCFNITLPSTGSVSSAFWEMLSWGTVDRILWLGVLCLMTWYVRNQTNLGSCSNNGHGIHIRFSLSQFPVLGTILTSVVMTTVSFRHSLFTGINSFHDVFVRFSLLHRICANFRSVLFQVHRKITWNEFCRDAVQTQIPRQISKNMILWILRLPYFILRRSEHCGDFSRSYWSETAAGKTAVCGAYGGGEKSAQGFGGKTWGKEAIGETQM